MKQKILEALTAKFQGVDAKTLEGFATKLAETTLKEEDVATAVEGVTLQQVFNAYADRRATEASISAVKNYEKKYELKDGVKVEKEGGKPEPNATHTDPDTQSELEKAVAQALAPILETQKSITERFARMDTEKLQNTFHSSLSEQLKSKSIPEYFFTPIISGREFKDEEAVNTYVADVEKMYADFKQQAANDGFEQTIKPDTAAGGKDSNPLAEAIQSGTEKIKESKKTN